MLNLYTISTKKEVSDESLTTGERLSVYYHNIFDYPLNIQDLVKWKVNDSINFSKEFSVSQKSGYFYVEGSEGLVYKRILRERISAKKLSIAKRAAKILSFIPSIQMVAVTGSLAMRNSSNESDIDLMIITKENQLWISRLLAYIVLKNARFSLRKPGETFEKDKLCLNIWLDRSSLAWKKSEQNIYTAHEISQVMPLVNKNKTYETFLDKNKWVLNYWPNAIKVKKLKEDLVKSSVLDLPFKLLEKFAYKIQMNYMKGKKTREVVKKNCALFHPQDWSEYVLNRIEK